MPVDARDNSRQRQAEMKVSCGGKFHLLRVVTGFETDQ